MVDQDALRRHYEKERAFFVDIARNCHKALKAGAAANGGRKLRKAELIRQLKDLMQDTLEGSRIWRAFVRKHAGYEPDGLKTCSKIVVEITVNENYGQISS